MVVLITNLETGAVIGSFPVTLRNIDDDPISDREYFNEAWGAALADGLVKVGDRGKYSFRTVDRR